MVMKSYALYNPMIDRRSNPGAGAFCPYYEGPFVSDYPVAAGEELFVTYGERWYVSEFGFSLAVSSFPILFLICFFIILRFLQRKDFDGMPLKDNFHQADNIIALLWSMLTLEGASLQKHHLKLLLEFFQRYLVQNRRTRTALSAIESFEDIQRVFDRNGTAMATIEPRSNDWLEDNGRMFHVLYLSLLV